MLNFQVISDWPTLAVDCRPKTEVVPFLQCIEGNDEINNLRIRIHHLNTPRLSCSKSKPREQEGSCNLLRFDSGQSKRPAIAASDDPALKPDATGMRAASQLTQSHELYCQVASHARRLNSGSNQPPFRYPPYHSSSI